MTTEKIHSYLKYESENFTSPVDWLYENTSKLVEPFMLKWADFNGKQHFDSFIYAKDLQTKLNTILKPGKSSESADIYQIFIYDKPISDKMFSYILSRMSTEPTNDPNEYFIKLRETLLVIGILK